MQKKNKNKCVLRGGCLEPLAGGEGAEDSRKMVGAHQYSYSKGVFLGAGLEVSYFSTRDDDTREFYGINGRG